MLFAFLPLWLSIAWRPHRCLVLQLIAWSAIRPFISGATENAPASIHFHPQQGATPCPM